MPSFFRSTSYTPSMPKIDHLYGASFSLHRCSELDLDKRAVLKSALEELGIRHFRLMSYWNIHEPRPGEYNFDELDWQLDLVAKYEGEVSLCLGKRQPRWPECHMPAWALELPKEQWYEALYQYLEVVVKRYQNHPALASWQLENEALLKKFGYCLDNDYSRERLRHEMDLVRRLNPAVGNEGRAGSTHPLIMTLSDSWGLPLRRPRPDEYGMSLYRTTIDKKGELGHSLRPALFYKTRRLFIRLCTGRDTFIHELQAEPWANQAISDVPLEEQLQLMNPEIFKENVAFAKRTKAGPIDLWGLEWWYWLHKKHGNDAMWQAAKVLLAE